MSYEPIRTIRPEPTGPKHTAGAERRRSMLRQSSKKQFAGGMIMGVIAAIIMALAAMVYSWAVGLGFWLPVKNIAALFYGVNALIEGTGAIIVGLLTHLVVGGFFGGIFGLFVRPRTPLIAAWFGGLLWGAVVWVGMTYFALPVFNSTMFNRVMISPGWWFALHMIYGATLMFTPAVHRALMTRREEVVLEKEPRRYDRAA